MMSVMVAVLLAGQPDWQLEAGPVAAELEAGPVAAESADWVMEPESRGAAVVAPHPYTTDICWRAVRTQRRLLVAVGLPAAQVAEAAKAADNSRWLFAVDDPHPDRFTAAGLYVLVPVNDELFVERSRVELADVVSGERCMPCALAKQWLADHGIPYREQMAAADDRRAVPRITYRGRELVGYDPAALAALVRR